MNRYAIAVSLLAIAGWVQASQMDNMIDLATEQFRASGELNSMSACIGQPPHKVLVAYRETMQHCVKEYGFSEANESLMDSCIENQASNRLGVKPEELNRCMDQIPQAEEHEVEVDYSNMSQSEFKALAEKQREKALSGVNSVLEMSKAISKGTEDLITLPIYTGSEIVAHHTEGFSLTPGKVGIPVATFLSNDNPGKVAAFYEKELPDFETKKFDNDLIIFMQKIPKDFEPLKDLTMFQKVPHISISKLLAQEGSEAKTRIEIAYEKR